MKKIAKFLLLILAILFTILLSVDIIIFTLRKISEDYISERAIYSFIDNIDINDLLKENGKEIEQITVIKQKLVEAGIPEELVTDFVTSEPVKEVISESINQTTQYVLYGKEFEYELNTDDVYQFIEVNLPIISEELQEKNIPKSEYLTKENQEKILKEVKTITPVIENKINETKSILEDKWNNSEYKTKLDKILNIIRKIYSKEVTILLISIGIFSLLMIILTRRSFIKSFKWIGFSFLISSLTLFIITKLLPIVINQINEIPEIFEKILEFIKNNISINLLNSSVIYLITGILFITISIIISTIKNKKIKKLDNNL